MEKIKQSVPVKVKIRYDELRERLLNETLTFDEQHELIDLSDQIEFAGVGRLQLLFHLAQLRNTTAEALMDQLGLRDAFILKGYILGLTQCSGFAASR